MFNKKTIKDISFEGQNVLVRTDYNVPLDDAGNLTSDLRIEASLPTINYLSDHKAGKIILMSHMGRPDGKRDPKLSLAPVAKRLQELLPKKVVRFVSDCCGPEVEEALEKLPEGGILLLENLRYYSDEEDNSEDFARDLVDSTHAEVFVQDGFAVVHRKNSSTDAITHLLPSVAGFLVAKEVTDLSKLLDKPTHPFLVVIGGAKVKEKQPLVDAFVPIADTIVVGGKIAADGYVSINPKIIVANDFVENDAGEKWDIGPESIERFVELAKSAKTILWNGVLGFVEKPGFDKSSKAVAIAVGQNREAESVICGGDTTGYVDNLATSEPELDLKYSFESTGGGAALEFLSGKKLPGIEALEEK